MALGTSWVFATAVYFYLGYRAGMWLDARWGTEPFMLVAGLFLAVVLSLVTLIKETLTLAGTSAGAKGGKPRATGDDPKASVSRDRPEGEGDR
ncbi:MAG TPA: AtpZ/AtpI family protein [Limnochordia bacterium]